MAQNVCNILLMQEQLKTSKFNMTELPLGDLFRTSSLTPEDYELFSNHHSFTSID